MKLGGHGVMPYKTGGTAAPHRVLYDALKSAMGDGGSGEPGSIVEAWRNARARGLAASWLDKRAALQALPHTATASLPVFERLLGRTFLRDVPEQDRRDALSAAWVDAASTNSTDLLAALVAIVPTATLYTPDSDLTRETQHGRGFEDWDPGDALACGPVFNLAISGTRFPNYADDFVEFVGLNFVTALDAGDYRAIALLKERLHDLLPAWISSIVYNEIGFTLDEDLLDLTVFGE